MQLTSSEGAVPEDGGSVGPHFRDELGQSRRALHLLGGLPGIDGHQEDSHSRSSGRGSEGLDQDGQLLRILVAVEEGQDARVGRRVTKPRQRTLKTNERGE